MQTITASHLKLNQPPIISNGYKNWWDVVGQSTMPIQPNIQPIQSMQAPSYGVYTPTHIINNSISYQQSLQPITQLTQPMSLITSIKGCGCGSK